MRMVRFVAAAAFLVACHGTAQAIPIGIVDAGFEDPPTSTSSIGAVSGWTISGSGAGVWNIGASPLGFWTVGATQGNQVAFVGREAPSGTPASISQVLSATLMANAAYSLTGEVGHPIGFGGTASPATTYTISLLAGSATLSSITGTGPEGTFAPFTLTYDSTGSAFFGKTLQIVLTSSKTQTAFDAIALDATGPGVDAPEPASLALLCTGLLGLMGSRRRWLGPARQALG